jgi:hypothetical protein
VNTLHKGDDDDDDDGFTVAEDKNRIHLECEHSNTLARRQ